MYRFAGRFGLGLFGFFFNFLEVLWSKEAEYRETWYFLHNLIKLLMKMILKIKIIFYSSPNFVPWLVFYQFFARKRADLSRYLAFQGFLLLYESVTSAERVNIVNRE